MSNFTDSESELEYDEGSIFKNISDIRNDRSIFKNISDIMDEQKKDNTKCEEDKEDDEEDTDDDDDESDDDDNDGTPYKDAEYEEIMADIDMRVKEIGIIRKYITTGVIDDQLENVVRKINKELVEMFGDTRPPVDSRCGESDDEVINERFRFLAKLYEDCNT